jgi:superfamily II DNA or RNA helicase
MGVTLSRVTATHVRAVIARAIAGGAPGSPAVGSIVLHAHQREAVARVQAAFAEFGGALLADATGLGKTYVALAVAGAARKPLIVGPAALKDMWTASAQAAERSIPFVSMESLSRASASRASAMTDPDLVIIDEAHHARNPATARYRALALLTARARVLLLTATPVHNTHRDLKSLLALFLGARAEAVDANALMRCVIRRTVTRDGPALPNVSRPRLLSIPDDEARMNAIVALPPPVPPSDGGDGGILLIYSLLRRWASSQGALVESLRSRLARATALIDGLEAGRYPSSRELAAWTYADGAMQLAFPELIVDGTTGRAPATELATTIKSHVIAVRALLDQLRRSHDLDESRARHITSLRASHPGAKIVAFTQYAETVAALFGHLRDQPGVAALTASGARVAGGTVSRTDALARFAPEAQGARAPRTADAIDLLLTTDLVSEGVNLQDASVVVHLDLPWTPARLEQRVGRAARIGSRHDSVIVYSMQPPASAERLVRVEERLRAKLGITARTVGVVGTILPHLSLHDAAPGHTSPSELRERLAIILGRWATQWETVPTSAPRPDDTTVAAAVLSLLDGYVALVEDGGALRLVAALGNDDPSDDPERVLRAIIIAEGPDTHVDESELRRVVRSLERWHRVGRDRLDITLDGALHARARRAVVDRIAAIARRTPRHLRPGIAELAATARRTATARYGAGAERVLDQLASAELPDEAWLRAIGTFGQLHASEGSPSLVPGASVRIRAILLLVPAERETPAAPAP